MLSYSISSVSWWTNNDPTDCHFGSDSNKFIHKVLIYSSQGLTIASDLLRYMFKGALLSAMSTRELSFTFGISPIMSSWSWLTPISPQSECLQAHECIDFAATDVFCRLLVLPQLLSWCSVFLMSISKECPLHLQNCATYFEYTLRVKSPSPTSGEELAWRWVVSCSVKVTQLFLRFKITMWKECGWLSNNYTNTCN